DFGHAFFIVIELFERKDREIDVMFLEPEEARRIMHQNVGIEHEQLVGRNEARGRAGLGEFGGLACNEGERNGTGLALDHGPPWRRRIRRGIATIAAYASPRPRRTQALVPGPCVRPYRLW